MYCDDFNDSYKIDQAVATLVYTGFLVGSKQIDWNLSSSLHSLKSLTFLLCKILDEDGLWLARIEPETKKN